MSVSANPPTRIQVRIASAFSQDNDRLRGALRDLRLRGIPAHLADALNKLESSVASSEASSHVQTNSPSFTTRMYSLTTRLLEFVNSVQLIKDENAVVRKHLQEIKQKTEEREDGYLREITKLKILLDEKNTELQNLRNDLELSTVALDTIRTRAVELEKDNLSLQRRSQNLQEQCQNLSSNLQKVMIEKREIKEVKDMMEVELASERNRNNHLAGELQVSLQQIERSKTHLSEATGFSLAQECLSCAKRRSLEEKLKQKIQCLESELEASKNDAQESEKKLQALAEELRSRVLEEKVRSQKLARRNSQLAAERMNAAQQLHAFEEVLNKAHSKTFSVENYEEAPPAESTNHADEALSRELAILRRLGVIRDGDATQSCDAIGDCATM